MAFTVGNDVYAALHETGVNTFIQHVYDTRRYYFHYAVPPLGSGTPGIDFEVLPPLPVPIAGYGMAYSIDLSQPVIDFSPENGGSALPPPLALGANQFSLFIEAIQICVACGLRLRTPNSREQVDFKTSHVYTHPGRERDDDFRPQLICTRLQAWAVGHPTVVSLGGADSLLGLKLDHIVIKEVCDLEQILECLAKEVVDALLERLQLTLKKITFEGFPAGLGLAAGPEISDDQLKVWAKII